MLLGALGQWPGAKGVLLADERVGEAHDIEALTQSLKDDDASVERSRFYGYGGPFGTRDAKSQGDERGSQAGSPEGDEVGELVLQRDTTTAGLLGLGL